MYNSIEKLIEKVGNDDKYIKYLKKYDLYRFFPSQFFELQTEQERLEAWDNIEVKLKDIGTFNKVANPYFIGFGNPEAELLIVGQEKAFNAFTHPQLMLYESINNSFQWAKIKNNKEDSDINFDPRNPRKHHKRKLKGNHTWTKYSILTDAFYGINSCHENIKKDWSQNRGESLFDKVFITELNVTPAVNHSGLKLTEERKELLSDPFFRYFKVVVFAIGNPLDDSVRNNVRNIFAGIEFDDDSLGSYGKDKSRAIAVSKNTSQKIVICNQLSGSSGWKNEHIISLGKKLRVSK